jgi:hypothetical protein
LNIQHNIVSTIALAELSAAAAGPPDSPNWVTADAVLKPQNGCHLLLPSWAGGRLT